MAAVITVALVSGTLTHPATEAPWYDSIATGLPAFADGKWWTLFTAPFFIDTPITLVLIAPVLIIGLGLCEYRLGTKHTLTIFIGGHVVGIIGASLAILALATAGWDWALALSNERDVGASCGAFACLAFGLASLPAPWRLRSRVALGAWAVIELVYLGELANVEHGFAILCALAVSAALPRFRHPFGRPSVHEWRLLCSTGLIVIAGVQLLDLFLPPTGPFGDRLPDASAIDVALDVAIILVIGNGVRIGIRAAWIAALVLAVFNLVTAAFGFALAPVLLRLGLIDSQLELLGLLVGPGLLWAIEFCLLWMGRSAFGVQLRPSHRVLGGVNGLTREDALTSLRHIGGSSLSWKISWPLNEHLAVGDGSAAGVVTYQVHSGVALALGDPIVAAGNEAGSLQQFRTQAERAGLVPCVFAASVKVAAARPAGWRSTIIAQDLVVDLPHLALTGKAWHPVRTSMHAAARAGITFQLTQFAETPRRVRSQVHTIAEAWVGDKGLPEMRFTLDTVEEAMDPETRVGLAFDADGDVLGVTSWLPVYGPNSSVRGWTLDLMRRRAGGFGPVMEFLIASAALHFSETGAEFVSLSGAPLTRPSGYRLSAVDQVLDRLGVLIEPQYGLRSLHQFKMKFHPRSAPLSLLYRDEGDLPRISIAVTHAYLPDTSLRQLLIPSTRPARV